MLTIINTTGNIKIDRAIQVVLKHYRDEEFLRRFKEVTFSCGSTYETIMERMANEQTHSLVTIGRYRPWWFLSRAVAKYTTTTGGHKTILFNQYRLDALEVSDLIETVFHEICHHWGFKHVTNYRTAYNLETVPYKLSTIFKQYIFIYYPNEL